MMELLPPVGWADVATKRDLDQLEGRMDLRFDKVDLRFDQLEERMDLRFGKVDLRIDKVEHSMNLRFDKVTESIDLRFDATVSSFHADLAESGRRMQGVFLTAIVAATSLLAALSVFGPK